MSLYVRETHDCCQVKRFLSVARTMGSSIRPRETLAKLAECDRSAAAMFVCEIRCASGMLIFATAV